MDYSKEKIAVIGLGYVGLPLAVEFAKKRKVVGFDLDTKRISELKRGKDKTNEVEQKFLKQRKLEFSSDKDSLKDCGIFIITVPTPINKSKEPDLRPLRLASKTVSKFMKKGSIVIYESTVYPGVTEEVCLPILESGSKLLANKEFYYGYSPERVNPADKKRKLTQIKKIISGSNKLATKEIKKLYLSIVKAGVHPVSSIRVAEAAKVIENTQRDLNIALINELSILFNKLDLDSKEILEAAGTKWNFMPFKPGLVGGHCIGVDPYYLTFKAEKVGIKPDVILAGRKTNDLMPKYIVEEVKRKLKKNKLKLRGSSILVLGITFKENCGDFRNSKSAEIVKILSKKKASVDIFDPWVKKSDLKDAYGFDCLTKLPTSKNYSAIIIAVSHEKFKKISINRLRQITRSGGIIYDVKSIYPRSLVDGSL